MKVFPVKTQFIKWYQWLWLWLVPTKKIINGDMVLRIKFYRGHIYIIESRQLTGRHYEKVFLDDIVGEIEIPKERK